MNEQNIAKLKPLVAKMARELVAAMKSKHNIDLLITSGYRSPEEQDAIYAQGRTTPGHIVTNAKGGQSFHNYGVAFDCVPLSGGKPDWNSSYIVTSAEAALIGLEHGDRGYTDLPHFQCRLGHSLEDFQDGRIDWKKYEVEPLPDNQKNKMDNTNTEVAPKTVIVKAINVVIDMLENGSPVQENSTVPVTVTPELVAALKLEDAALVEGGYNVNIIAE